jgi:putative transposase
VNWSRSIFSHVPSTKVREIAAMLKAIHVGEDIAAAQQKKAVRVIEKAARSAADYSRRAGERRCCAFPEQHWRRIRTTDEMDKQFFYERDDVRGQGSFFCRYAAGPFFRPVRLLYSRGA